MLPLLKRRPRAVGEVLPTLSLPGLALGDFDRALRGRLGEAAPWSSPALARLKAPWPREEETWKRRRLDDLEVVDAWAAGLYMKAGLEETKAARLGLRGALSTGQNIVLAGERGPRESKDSWGAGLRDRRARGLKPWRGTMADGHLGIWAA